MGCRATENGISIQFCARDGSPDGVPFYGRYAQLAGQKRDHIFSSGAATSDESKFKGSEDWLTLIAVADTREKLDRLVRESGIPPTACDTSGSSRRVQLELHLGGVRQSYKGRITIASGPIVALEPKPIIDVVHVKVLPEGTLLGDLGEKHPLVAEFQGTAITFITLTE